MILDLTDQVAAARNVSVEIQVWACAQILHTDEEAEVAEPDDAVFIYADGHVLFLGHRVVRERARQMRSRHHVQTAPEREGTAAVGPGEVAERGEAYVDARVAANRTGASGPAGPDGGDVTREKRALGTSAVDVDEAGGAVQMRKPRPRAKTQGYRGVWVQLRARNRVLVEDKSAYANDPAVGAGDGRGERRDVRAKAVKRRAPAVARGRK